MPFQTASDVRLIPAMIVLVYLNWLKNNLVIGQRQCHQLLSVGTDIETGKTANQVDAGVAGCFARVQVKNL